MESIHIVLICLSILVSIILAILIITTCISKSKRRCKYKKSKRDCKDKKFKRHLKDEELWFSIEKVTLKVPKKERQRYQNRVFAEKLFRTCIANLIKKGIVKGGIIDLGAWIGDNAAPWAKLIKEKVYAIDPSPTNCELTKNLKKLNSLNNLIIIQKAIGAKEGELQIKEGNIDHASFKEAEKGPSTIHMETLDSLVTKDDIGTKIGFIHLDVEGMEYDVLVGALGLIKRDFPVISTEAHKGDKDVGKILKPLQYVGWELPEVCGLNPSCRNTIWIHSPSSDVSQYMNHII